MAKKKGTKDKEIENLCINEDEEISFVDNPVIKGKKVATFDFDSPEEDATSILHIKSM